LSCAVDFVARGPNSRVKAAMSVIASACEAIQFPLILDCFVALAPRNDETDRIGWEAKKIAAPASGD